MEKNIQSLVSNIPALIALITWILVWKGIALWKAARRSELGWYVALLVLNTVGILEIIYIFAIARKKTPAGKEDYPAKNGNRRRII